MAKNYLTIDGKYICTPVSRWIKLQVNYNPSPSNSLWDYVHDGHGYSSGSSKFDPDEHDGKYLDYFRWKRKRYALDSFAALGSAWCSGCPYMYEDEDGKVDVIGYVFMDGSYFAPPLYLQMDEYSEYVRLWRVEDVSRL